MKKKLYPRKPFLAAMLTIPHKQLPDYPDIGSYRMNADNSPAFIGCADTGNDISNAAILLHEFIESFWCWQNRVTENRIRKWDQDWFASESSGMVMPCEEPGYHPNCPYRIGHLMAERFEREFIAQFGMMWTHHEKNCENIK